MEFHTTTAIWHSHIPLSITTHYCIFRKRRLSKTFFSLLIFSAALFPTSVVFPTPVYCNCDSRLILLNAMFILRPGQYTKNIHSSPVHHKIHNPWCGIQGLNICLKAHVLLGFHQLRPSQQNTHLFWMSLLYLAFSCFQALVNVISPQGTSS